MKRFRWLIVWLLQIVLMLVLSAALSASLWLGRALYNVCMWAVLPVCGLLTACLATVKGLLNYAAWIAPPLCAVLGHLAIWFYLPSAGPVLVTAFASLIGAAAGEVLLREHARKGPR